LIAGHLIGFGLKVYDQIEIINYCSNLSYNPCFGY
jgi:hypothetical protein